MAAKSINDWLAEGEQLFGDTLAEYRDLEAQLTELERQLDAKYAEVNRLAHIIGKPPVETHRTPPAPAPDHTVHPPIPGTPSNGQAVRGEVINNAIPNSPATIARALTGRGLGR